MKVVAVVIFTIFGQVLAVPLDDENLKFNEVCGVANDITRKQWNEFDLLSDVYPHDINCYMKCDLESDSFFKDGEFQIDYIKQIEDKGENDEKSKVTALIIKRCTEEAKSKDVCDKAGQFTQCAVRSTLGVAALVFLGGVSEGLSEIVAGS